MNEYDIAIIGSGLGGLECAYILSKEGYNVVVLEKNQQLGGSLQCFTHDDVIFDTGIHYVGGLDEGQNLNRYFRYYGIMDKVKVRRMDAEGFDVLSFEGDPVEYAYGMGYEQFKENMVRYFPKEKDAVDQYIDKFREVIDNFPLYNLDSQKEIKFSTKYADTSAKQFIDSLTTDEKLRKVLSGTNVLYEGVEDKTPLYVHALVVNSYIESSWRFVDGADQVTKLMARKIRQMGGTIMRYAHVEEIRMKDGKVDDILLKNGRTIRAKNYISNVHPTTTMDMMTGGGFRKSYENRVRNLDNSISAFTLHLVFKENSFPYFNKNYYHFEIDDVWNTTLYDPKRWPEGFMAFTPAYSDDGRWAKGMCAITLMRYKEVAQWEDSYNVVAFEEDRGSDYEDWKDLKSQQFIDKLEKKFPGIKKCIKSYNSSTPLTYRDYLGSPKGSIYGIAKDYRQPVKSVITTRTRIPNLYWTGQNVNLHGMLGVTVSATLTAGQFVGLDYLVDQIKKA